MVLEASVSYRPTANKTKHQKPPNSLVLQTEVEAMTLLICSKHPVRLIRALVVYRDRCWLARRMLVPLRNRLQSKDWYLHGRTGQRVYPP